MGNEETHAINVEFEIYIGGALISKGDNLDKLITNAKIMYPNKPIGIRKSRPHSH